MVGLLDGGLAASFGAVFGSYFLDGSLHRVSRIEAEDGDVSTGEVDVPIKYQPDRITESMRQAEGYTEDDAAFIVLQHGIAPAPTSDDELTASGARWAIRTVASDPASTHWIVHARPA